MSWLWLRNLPCHLWLLLLLLLLVGQVEMVPLSHALQLFWVLAGMTGLLMCQSSLAGYTGWGLTGSWP